jgi:hypothetical protein
MIEMALFFIGGGVGAVAALPFVLQSRKKIEADAKNLDQQRKAANTKANELDKLDTEFQVKQREFASRVIGYTDLLQENQILKRDLQNVDVTLNKLGLDHDVRERKQQELEVRSRALGERYLRETVKTIISSLGANNFSACKQKLLNTIAWCREIDFPISAQQEAQLLADLKAEFERAVKAAFEREEQSRIKAQIREEQKLQREVEAELKRLDRERAAIQAALDRALADAHDQYTDEVQRLQARLAEAEEKSRRAVSLAQQTKAGHVYVISNIGSFGKGVFKIGMTRRLDPTERVYELGSASVPFPFDVHMMISCENAPALENALHRELQKSRMNRVQPRKEFFRTDVETIVQIVKQHHGEVEYIVDAQALEYAQSMNISDEDAKYIDQVFDAHEDEAEIVDDV